MIEAEQSARGTAYTYGYHEGPARPAQGGFPYPHHRTAAEWGGESPCDDCFVVGKCVHVRCPIREAA
jgi:hypothetical protein